MMAPTAMTSAVAHGRLSRYRAWAELARAQTGKSWLTQLQEIAALRNQGGECRLSDYYQFKLYDESYLRGRGRQDFLGWKLSHDFNVALNPRFATLPAWDKLVFTQLAEASGLPVAPVLATYHRANRISPVLGMHLRSVEQAAQFLRDPSLYPLFGKPAFSQQGYGGAYLTGYEAATDSLLQVDGSRVAVSKFVERLTTSVDPRFHRPACGYLFQKGFAVAPEIYSLTGWHALCGVRMVCLNGPDGVVPISAVWKIAVPPNPIDNFSLGANGNLLAHVDLATGSISRVIGGFWPDTQVFEVHPMTGVAFAGFQLPGWAQVLDTCRNAGAQFPLMRIHHWDFAFTDQGPLILELNDIGGTNIPQLHGYGLLTEYTREFARRHVDARKHPWVKGL